MRPDRPNRSLSAVTSATPMRESNESGRAYGEDGAKILHLAPAAERRAAVNVDTNSEVARYGMAALEWIERAGNSFSNAERRLAEARQQGEAVVSRAIADLRELEEYQQSLESRLRSAEVRSQLMEDRLREHENRARQAEEWMSRLHEALQRNFSFQGGAVAIARE